MIIMKPKVVGMSRKRLKRVGNVMQRYIDQGKLAGSLSLLAREGEVIYCKCQGMMDVENDIPMQPDAIFRIFSMSKPITSVAALTLYEKGLFHLTDPVSRFIPEFADFKVYTGETGDGLATEDLAGPITIHHLLTHTSGLCYGLDRKTPVDALYADQLMTRTDESLAEKVKRLAELPLLFQPGTRWHYSVATDVLGYLVEVVSGMPLDAYLKQTVFEPLDMIDTDFFVPEEKRDRLAQLYQWNDQAEIVSCAASGTDAEVNAWLTMERCPAFLSGGGGLVSTAEDYLHFAMMLSNRGELDGERILGTKTVELMTMNHLLPEQHIWDTSHRGFGLGVGINLDVAQSKGLGSEGTFGWGGAASTDYWYDPQEDLIGILMVQLLPSGVLPLGDDFRTMAYQAIVD